MAEEMWRDLSDKEKGFFGGSKSIFQAAKAAAKAGGGDINLSLIHICSSRRAI